MFHAPTTEAKQQNDPKRSQSTPERTRELSPRVPATMGPASAGASAGAAPPGGGHGRGQPLAHLHSTYGNQAVLRMLSRTPPVTQTKLTVNQPGDQYEQEADRVADHVMRMTAPPAIQRKCSSCAEEDELQRKCAECEEQEKKTRLQRKEAGASPQFAPPSVHAVLSSPGRPLDPQVRSFMEPRFGCDFSQVRVHDDQGASDSARDVNALAYTVENHTVFGAGQYARDSTAGRQLIAHELAHVIQQGASSHSLGILRKPVKFGDCAASGDKDADLKVENARQQAISFVQVTIRDLKRAPSDPAAVSKAYRQALKAHFITPDDRERATIRENYQSILNALETTTNIVCASSEDDINECQKQTDPLAFVKPGGKTIILCPNFMGDSITCRAITLIHEAAHTIGIGAKASHPPYRGSAQYPGPEKAAPANETTALRMDNPDAYGYFAANIWRETDTLCLPAFKLDQVIEIHGTAPPQENK